MIDINYNTDQGILEVYYLGDISLDELLSSLKYMADNSSRFPQKLLVLTDATKGKLNLKIENLPQVAQAIAEAAKQYRLVINAYIIDNPNSAVLSTLFKELSKNVSNFLFYIYSTREAAIGYLLNHKA